MRVAFNPVAGALMRDGKAETQMKRRSRMEVEAEMRGTSSQAQDHLEPPEAGRGRKEPPLEPVEGAQPCPPGPQTPGLQS